MYIINSVKPLFEKINQPSHSSCLSFENFHSFLRVLSSNWTGNSLCKILSLTNGSCPLRTNQLSLSQERWKYVEKHTLPYTTTRTTLSRFDSGLNILHGFLHFVPRIPARFTESRKRERYLSDQVYISSKISHKAIEQTILRLLNDCRKSISRAITLTKHKTGPGGVLPRILERVCRKGSWTLALFKDWESETDTLSKAQSRKMTPCTIILLINNVAWREVTCVYPLNGY